MKRLFLSVLAFAAFLSAPLVAQEEGGATDQCTQTVSSGLASCASCVATTYTPEGLTIEASCDDDCRSGTSTTNCVDCCFVCEANITGPGIFSASVGVSGGTPDKDTSAPFIVQLQVQVDCKTDEDSTKCVEFVVYGEEFNAFEGEMPYTVKLCYMLNCLKCKKVENGGQGQNN